MKVELNDFHRKLYADKAMELVVIAVGSLVFGQFLSERQFSGEVIGGGLVVVVLGVGLSYTLLRKVKKE